MWVRLIFENSTVCLISRRISLFCPVDVNCVPFAVCLLGGWLGVVGVSGFFDDDSGNVFCQCCFLSWMWLLLIVLLSFGGGGMFSMESLILAQDERWRRA